MALRRHLRETKRKGLDEESTGRGQMVAQNKRLRQARSSLLGFPARHTLSPAMPCYLARASTATAGHPTDDQGRTRL